MLLKNRLLTGRPNYERGFPRPFSAFSAYQAGGTKNENPRFSARSRCTLAGLMRKPCRSGSQKVAEAGRDPRLRTVPQESDLELPWTALRLPPLPIQLPIAAINDGRVLVTRILASRRTLGKISKESTPARVP